MALSMTSLETSRKQPMLLHRSISSACSSPVPLKLTFQRHRKGCLVPVTSMSSSRSNTRRTGRRVLRKPNIFHIEFTSMSRLSIIRFITLNNWSQEDLNGYFLKERMNFILVSIYKHSGLSGSVVLKLYQYN